MKALDFLIIAIFFLLCYIGKIGVEPLSLAGLFGVLTVSRMIRGETL